MGLGTDCGLTAIMSASAIQQWYLPGVRLEVLATCIVHSSRFNLCGIRWTVRLATPIAAMSAGLAFFRPCSGFFRTCRLGTSVDVPFECAVFRMVWQCYQLDGRPDLIGFAAPAFEAASCHVGETINPNRNVPRAMLASG